MIALPIMILTFVVFAGLVAIAGLISGAYAMLREVILAKKKATFYRS